MADGDDEKEGQMLPATDYMCIRTSYTRSLLPGQRYDRDDTAAKKTVYWVGHAEVKRVRKRKKRDTVDVYFELHKDSPSPPLEVTNSNVKSCIEVLNKSEVDRRTEVCMKQLTKATDLAEAIAFNKTIPKLDKDHLDLSKKIERDLPKKVHIAKNNMQQLAAIDKALVSSFSLIWGPPGTGKTYTGIKLVYLFDKINKIWNQEGNTRMQVLYCGPSNKSVDLVARLMMQRLGDVCPKIVRMYGRAIETVDYPVPGLSFASKKTIRDSKPDRELRSVSLHHLIREEGKLGAEQINRFDKYFREHPDQVTRDHIKKYRKLINDATIEELSHYDVILCTTSVAGNPKLLKGTKVYQCIIDESGMCTEPQTMVPIIATKAKQVVLIGDHKQLRPIIMCSQAAELGLETSLFERYAGKHATLLNLQYRMNPRICDFPSKTFYDGKLETVPSVIWQVDEPLKIWQPNPHIPHIFCHIEGEETALTVSTEEGNEQSKSNEAECQHVLKIFQHIVEREGVNPKYINIISQYNAQCYRLREVLRHAGYININVNTVVASQGGEWDYVIFSLVRSQPEYKIEENPTIGWCKQNLGFITDVHQVNVALTRARKGLIILGNKKLLQCDQTWSSLINHYQQKDCVKTKETFPTTRPRKQKTKRQRKQDKSAEDPVEFFAGTIEG